MGKRHRREETSPTKEDTKETETLGRARPTPVVPPNWNPLRASKTQLGWGAGGTQATGDEKGTQPPRQVPRWGAGTVRSAGATGGGSEGEVDSEQVPWAPRGDDVLGAPPPKEQWRKRRGLPRRKMGCLTGTEACLGRKRSLRRRLPPGMWAAAQSQGPGGSSSPSSGRRERPGWRPG